MNQTARNLQVSPARKGAVAPEPKQFRTLCSWSFFLMGLVMLAMPMMSLAESQGGASGAQASLNFRINIPAIIRVSAVTQPHRMVIEERHIAQGYIDLDAGASVTLTTNSRNGYQLTASYDTQLLSKVEVRVTNQNSSQNLVASSGFGAMRVASGLITDKLVPIGYRLHLAPGVPAGDYRWPVALAFSLAMV